jgi:hypothetical protein
MADISVTPGAEGVRLLVISATPRSIQVSCSLVDFRWPRRGGAGCTTADGRLSARRVMTLDVPDLMRWPEFERVAATAGLPRITPACLRREADRHGPKGA